MDLVKIQKAVVWLRLAATADIKERDRLLDDVSVLGLTRYDRKIAAQIARAK